MGDGGKKPSEVDLVDSLGEEGDDPKKPSGIRAELLDTRSWELVATDESTVLPKTFLDMVVVENS